MAKPKVAFLCVHNACRSQMAQALGQHFAADVFESYSAGTAPAAQIQPDAVRILRALYGIDMLRDGQTPKLLAALPPVDIVVAMGCNVQCPALPCRRRMDWGSGRPHRQGRRSLYLHRKGHRAEHKSAARGTFCRYAGLKPPHRERKKKPPPFGGGFFGSEIIPRSQLRQIPAAEPSWKG